MRAGIVVAVLLALGGTLDATQWKEKDVIVIDGKNDPGQPPQWMVWQSALGMLAQTHGEDSAFTHDLRFGAPEKGQLALAPEEWEMLDAEGQKFARLEAERERQAVTLQAKYGNPDWTDAKVLAKVDPKVLARADEEAWATDLKYRQGILDARDTLLNAFTGDSLILLLNWVEEYKEEIQVTTPTAGLARLRQPE